MDFFFSYYLLRRDPSCSGSDQVVSILQISGNRSVDLRSSFRLVSYGAFSSGSILVVLERFVDLPISPHLVCKLSNDRMHLPRILCKYKLRSILKLKDEN